MTRGAIWLLVSSFVVSGCRDKTPDDTSSADSNADSSVESDSGGSDDTALDGPQWSILAEGIGEGMLLSGWTDSGEMLVVGGGMGNAGPGVLVRYDGDSLCTETLVDDAALWWIHGPREGEWYAVGVGGTVVHYEDGTYTREDVDTHATLYGVWTTDEVVIAVGGDVQANTGEIWAQRDGEWNKVAGNLPGVIFKVWKGWFVGSQVAYYGYLPETEKDLEARPPGEHLLTVRGPNEDEVWAVGGKAGAAVLHWVDGGWEQLSTKGLSQPIMGVWTAEGEQVWVGGSWGTQAFGVGDGDWTIPDFPLTTQHIHGVWKHGDEVFFLGGNMMDQAGPWHGSILRYGENTETMTPTECP